MHELPHQYGDRIHLLSDLMSATELTALCDGGTKQRTVIGIVKKLYRDVLLRAVIEGLFPRRTIVRATPMADIVGRRGILEASVIDPATRVVIATPLRAAAMPAGACFNRLVDIMDDGVLRQDYLGASRQTDDTHRVTGTAITYKKVEPITGRILLIPDPMGATGGTIVQILQEYEQAFGLDDLRGAQAIAALHLIITPEYIRRVSEAYPQVHIYALRLDRGMSDEEVQRSVPGTYPDREFGLTDTQYIAPGAGDMGFRLTGAA